MPAPNESDRIAILRILDANANRAEEGLRVVEEYWRFVVEDRYRTELCKQLRHDLANAIAEIPVMERFGARETQADIGTSVTTADEYQRSSARDVALASQKRVEQAMRCLEEYAKPLFPRVATSVEQLRYRLYTLARGLSGTSSTRDKLDAANLYVLIDGGADEKRFRSFAEMLVSVGVPAIQLRDKSLDDRELLARARYLRELTRGTKTLFVMNDRVDLAVLADADGVHVGQRELSVKDARTVVGTDKLVGVSTHCLQQARQAVLDGADYIGCGPTFPSQTKQFDTFSGTEFLREVAAEISLPAFAIGGIHEENLPDVLGTGIRRVAVSGAIGKAMDPADAVRRMLSILERRP